MNAQVIIRIVVALSVILWVVIVSARLDQHERRLDSLDSTFCVCTELEPS